MRDEFGTNGGASRRSLRRIELNLDWKRLLSFEGESDRSALVDARRAGRRHVDPERHHVTGMQVALLEALDRRATAG